MQKISSNYSFGSKLGATGSSTVYEGTRLSDNLPIAIKFIHKNSPISSWKIDRTLGTTVPMEIFLLKRLSHHKIITFIDVLEDENYFYLITELFGSDLTQNIELSDSVEDSVVPVLSSSPPTDLFTYISQTPQRSFPSIIYIFQQIAQAVEYLHRQGIVHRDIKDENIVIDQNLNVKLIDFGAADKIPIHSKDYFKGFRGSLLYTPPELITHDFKQARYRGPEVDMWCLGIVLYVLAFGGLPFNSLADIKEMRFVIPPNGRGTKLETLINLMLERDISKRCTIDEVLDHPLLCS